MWLLIVLALIALQPFPPLAKLVQTYKKTPEGTAAHNVEAELEKLDDEAEEAAKRGDASVVTSKPANGDGPGLSCFTLYTPQ